MKKYFLIFCFLIFGPITYGQSNTIYKIDKNPLTWLDTMLNAVEHMNFFEGRATEYSKASTQGNWTEAFS